MRLAFAGLVLLLSALAVGSSAAQEPGQYMVEMALWIDGEQRGTPMVVTEAGKRATVEMGDPPGENGWRVEVLVEPPADAEGAPAGAIWLHLEVYRREDGALSLMADSLLGVPEGRPGVLSVVESERHASEATPENSLVYLTAQASLLRPSERSQ